MQIPMVSESTYGTQSNCRNLLKIDEKNSCVQLFVVFEAWTLWAKWEEAKQAVGSIHHDSVDLS